MYVVLFWSLLAGIVSASVPTVTIKDGKLEGHLLTSANGREFQAFEGIPYAQAPIKNLRFEPPVPVKPWSGILKATTLYRCLQYDHFTKPGDDFVKGDEDCLYLNVYTPSTKSKNLDVIVFIHGGAFMFNSGGLYRPNYIMDRDVIYITLNYRLGPLGFLSTEDKVLPGNNGLRDQNMALKWIKDNVELFGGNPNSVMIAGMSAGGASVQLHTLVPQSKGLFHRAIAQSGCALNPWVLVENSFQKAKKLANHVGCTSSKSKNLVACLKTRSGRQIVGSVKHFFQWLYNPFSPFGVVVDKWSDIPVLPEHPYILLQKKKVADVPIIFSYVNCEGLYPATDFISDLAHLNSIETRWTELIPHILDYNNTILQAKDEISSSIKKEYFGKTPVANDTFLTLVEMIGDRMFVKDIMDTAKMHSAAIKSPVYNYVFSYSGEYSKTISRSHKRKFNCAAHGDDTYYVLSTPHNIRLKKDDKLMSDILIDMWTSFANKGIPNVRGVEWPQITKEAQKTVDYIYIASPENITIKSGDDFGNRKFWSSLPIHENKDLLRKKDEL